MKLAFLRCPLLRTLLLCLFLAAPALAFSQSGEAGQVRVYHELNSDDSFSFYADNHLLIPAYVRLDFSVLQNLSSGTALPHEQIIAPGALRVELLRLMPAKGKATKFAYTWLQVKGDPINTVPVSDWPYLLPFEHGKKFKIVQGFNGKFTHFGQNQYAVDFATPEGTPVCASRDGLVIDLKGDSSLNGTSAEYNQHNNYIWIYHADGTFGTYVHLKQNGVLVKVGDQVKAGQVIGLSGNTGLSSGPHLHFDLRVPTRTGEMQSIPFEFLDVNGELVVPQTGEYYYANHPGQAPFPVILGRELSNQQFAGYIEKANPNGKVNIRSERIDDTFVLYLNNGTPNPVNAKVSLTLSNLRSSAGNPITVSVPAQAEVFLGLLQAVDTMESYSFNASINANWAR